MMIGRLARRSAFTLVVLLIGCGQPAVVDRPADPDAFVGSMRRAVQYDFTEYESPRALAEAASLVVVGHIADIVPGRTIEAIGTHATLVVDVDRIVKGSEKQLTNGQAFVELVTSAGTTVEQYRSTAPTGRALYFLDDRTDIPATGDTGAPEGASIFAPMPPGLVFEDGARFVGGYEDLGTMPEKWILPANFDELVRATER